MEAEELEVSGVCGKHKVPMFGDSEGSMCYVCALEAEEEIVAKLREALDDIRENQGRVCPNFESCTHESCKSSHASWEIARAVLKGGAS